MEWVLGVYHDAYVLYYESKDCWWVMDIECTHHMQGMSLYWKGAFPAEQDAFP